MKRWQLELPPYEVGKDGFTYLDVKRNKEGWACIQMYLPMPYDLVAIKTQYKSKKGWWNGLFWEGYRIKPDERVLFWKIEQRGKNG